MMAYGLSRSHLRALLVVCSVLCSVGCHDGGSCEETEDVRGEWRGTYIESDGSNETITLTLTDEGARISGSYELTTGDTGTLSGLQSGSQLVFTVQQSIGGECFGEVTGDAQVCGNSLSYSLECDGSTAASGTLTRKSDDTCKYANDGECDEPTLCDVGTDSADCAGGTCRSTNDGICDEPEGTGRCMQDTDTNDCGQSCPFTNNGVCNEPEGTGQCDDGTDVNDCSSMMMFCSFQFDGICDEPEGTGRCSDGTDFNDCNAMMGCPFQNDGICDEPEGTGRCSDGTDFMDCGFGMPVCPFQNDGICDEPEGTGDCSEGTDFNDCAGCTRTNDGVCDEPQGTGQCAEGSDVNDCAASEVLCGATLCSVRDPSGLGQLDACCTANEECGVIIAGGVCTRVEEAQPGSCAPYTSFVSNTSLAACCLPSGSCGLELEMFIENGCVSVDAIPILGIDEVPCDQGTDDGGVE